MPRFFGRVLIALSLLSVAFASLSFLCGVLHAVWGARGGWIYDVPKYAPALWLVAQLFILFAWIAFLITVSRRVPLRALNARDELSPLLIAWLPLVVISMSFLAVALERAFCFCGCGIHDRTWNDLAYVAAALPLPMQRILLVRAILRRTPTAGPIESTRLRGAEPTSA